MGQLKYESPALKKDLKEWVNPRSRAKVSVPVKAELALRKNIFSTLDIVLAVIAILIIKALINHVSVSFH